MNMEMVKLNIEKPQIRDTNEDLPRLLRSVNCQVLITGNKEISMYYNICNCDPEQKELICDECIKKCHSDHTVINRIMTKTVLKIKLKRHDLIDRPCQLDFLCCKFYTFTIMK